MRGSVRIYVNKKDREIYLLKEYKTKIGYWKCMGYLIQTDRESLKKEVLICIRDSISAYQQEIEPTEPFKSSPYKTWNKFFKYHDSISCEYDLETEEYCIELWTREGMSSKVCKFLIERNIFGSSVRPAHQYRVDSSQSPSSEWSVPSISCTAP